MSARQAILGRIRDAIGDAATPEARATAAARRVEAHPRGTIPKQARHNRPVVLFAKKAAKAEATVRRVKSYEEVAEAVHRFMREHELPLNLRHGDDERLANIVWPDDMTTSRGPSDGSDLTTVSHAEGAVAESGTLIMGSGPDNPTTLNFLAENHIVVLRGRDVQGSYEDIWTTMRRRLGKGAMPRTVNMITGPSRSADIEQKLILGAHGPLRLHIIVVED